MESAFEVYAHLAVARRVGLDKATIRVLANGRSIDALSDKERIAQRFMLQLVAERRVGADVYQAAQVAFGDKDVVDMLTLAGATKLSARLSMPLRVLRRILRLNTNLR